MRNILIATVAALCPLFALTACGGSSSDTSSSTGGFITVDAFSPQPVRGAVPTPFTVTGQNYASLVTPPGSTVTVRFTATSGTPFAGGTAATADVIGTVVDTTTVTGTSPLAVVNGQVPAFVTVLFASGLEATSGTPIAVFEGLTITSMTPATVASEIPAPFTITGDGFGPVAGTATIRFFLPAGTPYLGGTAGFVEVPGTIDSATSISGMTPIAGALAPIASHVQVTLPDTSMGATATPFITFEPPTLASITPVWVDAENPTALTLNGAGFGPTAATVTVRLQALTGTPFSGGTAAFLDVPGTVAGPTSVTANSPVSGLANKQNPDVILIFPSGARALGASPILTLEVAPDAQDDAYNVIGNIKHVQPPLGGVVEANDSDPDLDPITVTAFQNPSANGGIVTVAADGSFTYNPPAGFEGTDTFTYTLSDGRLTDTATVTMTVADMVWFIDNNALPGGDGRLTFPYDSVANFQAAMVDAAADTIYIRASITDYAGNLTLKTDQRLIGAGVPLTVGMTTVLPPTTKPTLANAATGYTVTTAAGNTISGLDLENTSGQALLASNAGTCTVSTVGVTTTSGGTGHAIHLDGGTFDATFDFVSITGSDDGIRLTNGSAGTMEVTGTTTLAGTTRGVFLDTGVAPALTFADLGVTGSGRGIDILAATTGSLTVSGTLTVTAPTMDGVRINGASIAVTFEDLAISDCGGHGIDRTSHSGALTCNGGLIDNPDDIGINAVTCSGALTLADLTIQETGDGAIPGQAAHGVLIDDCTGDISIDTCTFEDMNDHGATSGDDNNGIQVDSRDGGTLASVQIMDCIFNGTEIATVGTTLDHGVRIVLDNDSEITDLDDDGDACDIDDLNISMNGTAMEPLESQGDVIEVRVQGSSTLTTFAIDNNIIADQGTGLSSGYGILVNLGQFGLGSPSSATATGTINGNDIDNVGNSSIDRGIELLVQEGGTATIEIDSNAVDGQSGQAISVRCFDDATGNVTITNNDLGLTTANDTSGAGVAMLVQTRLQITAITLCVDIAGNDSGSEDYQMDRQAGTFNLLDLGAGTFTGPQVDTFLLGQNTGTAASLGSGYTQCTTISTP